MWTGKVNTATTKSDIKFMHMHIFFMYIKYKKCKQIITEISLDWKKIKAQN